MGSNASKIENPETKKWNDVKSNGNPSRLVIQHVSILFIEQIFVESNQTRLLYKYS